MKLRYRSLKVLLILGFVSVCALPARAQVGDIGRILQASTNDANILVKEYLKPFGSGFGAGLNTGWTNAAKPHKTLGFDLTVSSGLAVVPSADKTFDINQIGLQELELESGPSILQTINGADDVQTSSLAAYQDINNDGQQEKILGFDMPNGTGFGYVPAPQLKLGVGIIKDTELMLRVVPKVNIKDYGTFQQFGVGAKHGINQWLPGGKLLPVDLSLMVGYTSQTLTSDFRLTGEDVVVDPNNTENPYTNQSEIWDGQKAEIQSDAFTIDALVGKTLPVISIYGGVGIETSSLSISTPGTYPTIGENPDFQSDPNNEKPLIVKTIDEPIDVDMDGKNSVHALAGFRLRFAIFHISASYKLAKYSTLNAGFGISFR